MCISKLRSVLLLLSLLCCVCLQVKADSVVLWQTTTTPAGIWVDSPYPDWPSAISFGTCFHWPDACGQPMLVIGRATDAYPGVENQLCPGQPDNCQLAVLGIPIPWPASVSFVGNFGYMFIPGSHFAELPLDSSWVGYDNLYAWTGFRYTHGMEERLGGVSRMQLEVVTESCLDFPGPEAPMSRGGCTMSYSAGYVQSYSLIATYDKVPEPATFLTLGTGLAALTAAVRRKLDR